MQQALNIATRRTLSEAQLADMGVCPFCEELINWEVKHLEGGDTPVEYEAVCNRYGGLLQNTAGGFVIFHPAVVSFYYRRDVDIYRIPWQFMASHLGTATVVDHEPTRVEIGISIDEDDLTLVLDESATVVNVMQNDSEVYTDGNLTHPTGIGGTTKAPGYQYEN